MAGEKEYPTALLDLDGAQLMLEQPIDRKFLAGDLEYPYGRGLNLQIEVSNATMLKDKSFIAATAL